jgi:Family of unknown function (DUF5677)
LDQNEEESGHVDGGDDFIAVLERLAPGRPSSKWTNSEASLVNNAYDSVAAAYRLLLDCGESVSITLGDNDEALQALTEPLSKHYKRTVRQSVDLLADFYLEASVRGQHHQKSAKLREEATDVLSDCIEAFAACAEFGAKALSDQGNECVNNRLSVLPDSYTFAAFMRFLAAVPVGIEIAELARHGFADAVNARARSLHETAVVAMVVGKYAKQPELETAERYWDYQYVRQYKDFLRANKQLSAMRLRHTDLAMETGKDEMLLPLREAKEEYDRVIERYGTEYAQNYGWARNLVPADRRLNLSELEALTGGRLDSLDYMLASARIHPTKVLDVELVSILHSGLRHANSAWLHLVHGASSLLEEGYPTPGPQLNKETSIALFARTERALNDADEWIKERREEIQRLTEGGEQAVKKLFDTVRASRQLQDRE